MPTPEAVALSTAVTDAVIARILPVGEMICAPRAAVLVDSPAGAGKTFLIESVAAAVRDGVDIIPTIAVVKEWDRPRRVSDTERGAGIRARIELLERLVQAYRTNELREA